MRRAAGRAGAASHAVRARHLCAAAPSAPVYDVLVVGGGVVGSLLAALLRAEPLTAALRVAVVDPSPLEAVPPAPAVPSARCSTLTPASARALDAAGAWRAVAAAPTTAPFAAMQVWDARGGGHVRYTAAEAGRAELGHVAENGVLCAALAQRLRDDGGVTLHARDTLQELRLPARRRGAAAPEQPHSAAEVGADWAAARLAHGGWVHARLVVAADGARSATRTLAGLRTVGWRYDCSAVVGTVATPPHDTAWQRFLPGGPLALLPFRGGYSSVVWTTTPRHAAALAAGSDEAFAAEVHDALQGTGQYEVKTGSAAAFARAVASAAAALSPTAPLATDAAWQLPPRVSAAPGGRRAAFPLAFAHAAAYSAPRLALVGDAAHAAHPLAGQGLNLGIADAAALARTLAHGVAAGRDVGDALLLSEYAADATRANAPMLAALDGLQRLFAAGSPAAVALRSAGLGAVNALPSVRRAIIGYAIGEAPPLGELAQDTQAV